MGDIATKQQTTLVKEGESLEVITLTRKKWFDIFFLIIWLCAWTAGEKAALTELFQGNTTFAIIIWAVGWTIGGLWSLLILLWVLAGREILTIDTEELIIGYEIFKVGYYRNFPISDIKNLTLDMRVVEEQKKFVRRRAILQKGLIQFHYKKRQISFGKEIGIDNARRLVAFLQKHITLHSKTHLHHP